MRQEDWPFFKIGCGFKYALFRRAHNDRVDLVHAVRPSVGTGDSIHFLRARCRSIEIGHWGGEILRTIRSSASHANPPTYSLPPCRTHLSPPTPLRTSLHCE